MHQVTFKCDKCCAEFTGEVGHRPAKVWWQAQLKGWRQREYRAIDGTKHVIRSCIDCATPAQRRETITPMRRAG